MTKKKIWAALCLTLLGIASAPAKTRPANDLTTLPALQRVAAALLHGRQGSIVAIRPGTGEVLCMASSSTSASQINRAITGIYAPGSTFKTAQALTLLSEGIVNPEATFACNGGFTIGKTHVGCHKHKSLLNITGALAQSCNAWFCQAFMGMIGDTEQYGSREEAMNTWYDYMRSMGFGHTLGIDMNHEAAGQIPDGTWMTEHYGADWDERRAMFLGMGQGPMTVTPLQLCNLAATIANRGTFFTPHIHRSSAKANPTKYATRHWSKARRDAYETVVRGMRQAVLYGTCSGINTRAYAICGKTGTVENGGNDHSAFIGFAPMDRPQIAVAVFIEHAGFGADVAAPMAARIIREYMRK
jgi:penicillin-binding protein 2